MGTKFIEPPPFNMKECFEDSKSTTPLIFVLTPGAAPMNELMKLAEEMEYMNKLFAISLGQGQGPLAEKAIQDAMEKGTWVCLQNCHLCISWMPTLEKICEELSPDSMHPGFRLWLTSEPTENFPQFVLQNGVKMTNEPPKGFRANLIKSFANLVKEEDFEGSGIKTREWKKLICGLGFFHANIQERRKFGPLGWNIRYAFDESDLETSIACLRRFLDEQEVIPWDAINYSTGQINYGGRVTDDWDRRCIMNILSIYMTPKILEDSYVFSHSGTYKSPIEGSHQDAMAYFESLPIRDDPEVFGMHENANINF
jgi:dynein heavy chain